MSDDPIDAPGILNDEVILTEDAVAAVRIPISPAELDAVGKLYPKATVHARGPWMVITQPNPDDEL